MLYDGKIWVGSGENGPVCLLPSMANRHGLIAGATGTGKTVSLKVLAEGFSEMGVPVFLSDIKSDLSGMIVPGEASEAIGRRLEKCGVPRENFDFHAFPTRFWDVYEEEGEPIRATVRSMGPMLMSRMLGLNETQTGVMNILFRYCNDARGIPLETLADLKRVLAYMGERARDFTLEYGNVSVSSVGAIQRGVGLLEDQGGSRFFSAPRLDLAEWLKTDENGRGVINILAADKLFNHPLMYSTFLMWMLTGLYDLLPERGDADKPRIVFFFDEAHLLFDDCSGALMGKIEQVVRLIRSKGVGVYFITQSPADIPMSVLGQLGNRIQHALRAYTPLDQKAVRVAAQTFRTNPSFDTEEAITNLKTGEALVSFLDQDGAPGVVERATILPPQSHLGAVPEETRRAYRARQNVTGGNAFASSASPSTLEQAQVSAATEDMSQTFKVFDPATGQYVEKEIPTMTPVEPAPVQPQAVPTIQVQPAAPEIAPAAQPVPTIQVQGQPILQQMPVLMLDPTTGQYVQQMMIMQQDPATGNWMPFQTPVQAPAPVAPQAPVDPIALAEQQRAAEQARKEAERQAKEDARYLKEQEAAERRARYDSMREEAAERARRNDSLAGRIKNTAINTATRQVTSTVTRGITNAISELLGVKKRR